MHDLQEKVRIEYLRECFNYDPIEGKLYWNDDRPLTHFKTKAAYVGWKKVCSGKEAGCIAKIRTLTYRIVKVCGLRTTCSKVMYALYYGHYVEMVDHIDGNPLNNKIENLKASSADMNAKNIGLSKRNTSGIGGVSWDKTMCMWKASGSKSLEGRRRTIHLGYYDTIFEAACVRLSWQNTNGYSLRHGS